MSLLDLTLPAVKVTSVIDLQKMISETPDFAAVTEIGVPLVTDEDVRKAARKYIRAKLDLGSETQQEEKEADPNFSPPAKGFQNVSVEEVKNAELTMLKAGFNNKDEMLKMLDAFRREQKMLDVRKGELDDREKGIAEQEAVLSGRMASVEKKATEVGKQYAEYQMLFARVQEARKQGVIT